jgi:hypothetical protein
MFFSGHVVNYKCPSCGAECSDVSPSSILPTVAVVTFASVWWTRTLSHWVAIRWLSIMAAIAVSLASLWLIFWLFDTLTTRKLRKGICGKCGARLERISSGWYDGLIPNAWELVTYILTLGLAIGAAVLSKIAH